MVTTTVLIHYLKNKIRNSSKVTFAPKKAVRKTILQFPTHSVEMRTIYEFTKKCKPMKTNLAKKTKYRLDRTSKVTSWKSTYNFCKARRIPGNMGFIEKKVCSNSVQLYEQYRYGPQDIFNVWWKWNPNDSKTEQVSYYNLLWKHFSAPFQRLKNALPGSIL